MAWYADHSGILRHTPQHDRTGADAAVPPDRNVAKNFRSPTDHHLIFDRRVPLAVFLAGAPEGHALIQSYVVTDDRSLANDHPKPMIDE